MVDDAQLLFAGDFARSGVDLVLSKDGRDHVVPDYFKGSNRAALKSTDGATLSPDLVKALVGEVQLAQAGGATQAAATVIGTVSKLTGTATAIRNGVSVMLNVGDPVQKGDVVQAGAASSLNLTFIDGTVFGLSANARMVLNEMVYDPQGSSNSSLLSLIQGTVTFVAGETAKNGDMRVDTPVATMGIRGTAVLVEIGFEVPGQGGTPPVKFQVLMEPGGKVGSYVLYSKTTGQIIGTVNEAGQVTSVTGQGDTSTGPADPLTPIAQAIIQQTLLQYFPDYIPNAIPRSNGSGGGSAPGDPNSGTSPDPLKFLPPPDVLPGQPLTVPINLPGDAPGTPPINVTITRFNTAPTITVAPVTVMLPVDQTSFAIADQVMITDPDTGDIATPYVPGTARIISATGPSGTPSNLDLKSLVTVDAQTGQVSYDPAAFKFLALGQTAVYTIGFASQSGPDTTQQTIVFTVDGSNDAPTIATALTGAVTQGDALKSFDLLAGAADPDLGESATLTIGNLAFKLNGVALQTAPVGVTLTGTTLKVDPAAFAYLGVGQTATITVVYAIIDAHGATVAQTETITITGANDGPVIVVAGTAAQVTTSTSTAQGTIKFSDFDIADLHTATATHATSVIGTLTLGTIDDTTGVLGKTGTVNWTYAVNPDLMGAALVTAGGTLTETFNITISDGHGGTISQPVTVTVAANIWQGTGNWSTPANWSQGVPTASQFVLINANTNINLDVNAVVGTLLIASGAAVVLTTSGGTHHLDVSGDVFNYGDLTLAPGTTLQVSSDVHNYGQLTIDNYTAGSTLLIGSIVHLDGGGTVTLDGFADRIGSATTHAQLINHDNTINGYGTLGDGLLDITNEANGHIVADSYYKLTIDVRYADFINWGTIEANGRAGLEIEGNLVNHGELHAYSGLFTIDGDLRGSGTAKISGGSLEFGGWSDANVTFSGCSHDTLIIDRGAHFSGTVSGLSYGDSIDLKGIAPWQLWFTSHDGVVDVHYGRNASDYFTLADPNVLKHLDIRYDYRGGTELTWKNDTPEIDTSNVHLTKSGNIYALSHGSVTDADSSRTEQYTLEVTGQDSLSGTLTTVDGRLDGSFASFQGNGGQAMVTVKITDSFGASDQVNFIFSTATTPRSTPLALIGTADKDVIFASDHNDSLKGFGGADQFIFQSGTGKDTITDFQVGTDKIELDGIRGVPNLSGPFADLKFFLWQVSGGIEQHGRDAIVHLDGHNSVTLTDVNIWQLHVSDFIVHNQPTMA